MRCKMRRSKLRKEKEDNKEDNNEDNNAAKKGKELRKNNKHLDIWMMKIFLIRSEMMFKSPKKRRSVNRSSKERRRKNKKSLKSTNK